MNFFPKAYADAVARLRVPSGFLIVVVFAWFSRPTAESLLWGVPVSLAGLALRAWAAGCLAKNQQLATGGPYRYTRNPLYVGNIALWVGFALTARLVWLAPVILVLLGLEYHAIVRWEEQLLESRLGDAYRDYAARVPRWLPTFNRGGRSERGEEESANSAVKHGPYPWRETLFSERGTLLAIAGGYLLIWLKT